MRSPRCGLWQGSWAASLKEIDNHRGDQGSVGHIFFTELPENQQGGERSTGCVENIVANQNGGKGLVKSVADPQGFDCPLVALVCQGAKPHFTDTGVGCFTAGKIGRAQQKEYIKYTTRRIQEKPTPSVLVNFSILHYTTDSDVLQW